MAGSDERLLFRRHRLLRVEVKRRFFRPHDAGHPKRTPQATRARSWTRERLPPLIDSVRQVRVHKYVAIAIVASRPLDLHQLMPAVHPANGVRVDGKRNVLVYTGV